MKAEHDRRKRISRTRYVSPGGLAAFLDKTTVSTPALELLDYTLVEVNRGKCPRLIWSMPPQEGKSERVSRRFPLWLLLRNPNLRIAIASYELGVARRWGRAIRNDIAEHPELGLAVRPDTSAAHEWQLDGHRGGVYSVGIGGPLTGRPADVLIIDDPVKGRAEADSETYREVAWDWWTNVARTRLAPDAPVVLILTRWHEDDLAGRLIAAGGWRVVNIPAVCETEGDPLDRIPGEYLISARGRTVAQWEEIRRDVGARVWSALYQGQPSPVEGGLLKRTWWRYDPAPLAFARTDGTMRIYDSDQLIQSWDMAFKDTVGSDFVVGQVWVRRGAELHLVDQVRDRLDFPATCRAVEALTARWPQATLKLVEDKANGPAVIAQLRRTVSGLVAVNPKDSKLARVAAVSPFVEAGNIFLPPPSSAPWVAGFVEECAGFPNATHDDQVDAMTQAVARLMLSAGTSSFFDQLIRHLAGAPAPHDPDLELPAVAVDGGHGRETTSVDLASPVVE